MPGARQPQATRPSNQAARSAGQLKSSSAYSQVLQLFQRQRLDAGRGGLAERAAHSVVQAQGDGGFSECPAMSFAVCFTFLPATIQQDLGGAGVEQLVGGNAGEHHECFLTMECW